MGTPRKRKDWEGIALHFQKLQQSLLLAGTPPEQTAGCSTGWEESLRGKVPQDESAEGTWLQDCFCAGLKSYHCRVKLARRACTWDREKEEGVGAKSYSCLNNLSSEEQSGLPPSLEQTKLRKKSWKEKPVDW